MKELQIICVNDASTDGSLRVLNEYAKKDSRIEIIELKENVGGGKAKNIAIDKVTAPYFIIVDSDDYCALDMCEKTFNTVFEKNGKGYDIGYFGQSIIDFNTNEVLNKKPYISPAPWGKIYKTSIIQNNKLKFYEGKGTHDTPFFIFTSIFCERKTDVLKCQRLYFHNKNIPNSIQTSSKKKLKNKFVIFECYDFTKKILGDTIFKKNRKFINKRYMKSFLYVYKQTNFDKEIKIKIKKYFKENNFNINMFSRIKNFLKMGI